MANTARVLLVTSSIYPRGGGVAIHVQNIAYELVKNDIEVEVFSINRGYKGPNGVSTFVGGFKITYFSSTTRLLMRISRTDADIIHFHSYRYAPIAFSIIWTRFIKRKSRMVFTPHAIFPPQSLIMAVAKSLYDNTLGRLSFRMVDKIIALTPENREEILSCGADSKRVIVVPNGVRSDILVNLPSEFKFRRQFSVDGRYLLFVGRLAWHKGIEYLIEAMVEMKKYGVVLALVGEDGGIEGRLKNYAKRLGIQESVIFVGHVELETLLSAYAGAEAFVLPSSHEGLPTAVLEAMVCGKVVVSTYSAAGSIIRDGVDGYLVRYGDLEGLINVLHGLLSNRIDKHAISQSAVTRARGFDWSNLIKDLIEVYIDSGAVNKRTGGS